MACEQTRRASFKRCHSVSAALAWDTEDLQVVKTEDLQVVKTEDLQVVKTEDLQVVKTEDLQVVKYVKWVP